LEGGHLPFFLSFRFLTNLFRRSSAFLAFLFRSSASESMVVMAGAGSSLASSLVDASMTSSAALTTAVLTRGLLYPVFDTIASREKGARAGFHCEPKEDDEVQADEIESEAREPTTLKLHESAIAIMNGAKSHKWEALL